jgi:hypothetical protein
VKRDRLQSASVDFLCTQPLDSVRAIESKHSRYLVRILSIRLGCFLTIMLLTGCASSRTPVQLTVDSRVNQPLKEPLKAYLEVETVKDSRPVTDEFVLMQQSNIYGPTTGGYITEKTVAKIFGDGLNAALRQNGFETTNAIHYLLQSEIQSFDYEPISGIWAGRFTSYLFLYVHFELVNQSTRQLIWQKTYVGRDLERKTIRSGQLFAQGFSEASEDILQQLVSDQKFRIYFEQ